MALNNLELQRVFTPWYKDRDFPEIKSGNDDVVAVIENPKQLDRIILSQQKLLALLNDAFVTISDLETSLKYIGGPTRDVKTEHIKEALEGVKDFRESVIERSGGCYK